jgi:hypothetical protein
LSWNFCIILDHSASQLQRLAAIKGEIDGASRWPRNFSSGKEQIDRVFSSKNGNAPSISGCWCAGAKQSAAKFNFIRSSSERTDGRSKCTGFLLTPP